MAIADFAKANDTQRGLFTPEMSQLGCKTTKWSNFSITPGEAGS